MRHFQNLNQADFSAITSSKENRLIA